MFFQTWLSLYGQEHSLKEPYYAPFYNMLYKSQVSPECVCEVSAQNTPQIIYYIILQTDPFSNTLQKASV